MGNIMKIAIHDLRLTLRDRSAVLWMFILPVVFATFFGLVMGGSDSAPVDGSVGLTVLDLDGSDLSSALIEQMKDDRLALDIREPLSEPADSTVRTLVIPDGFEESVSAGVQSTLRLEKQPDTSEQAALVAQARIIRSATRLITAQIMAELSETEGASTDNVSDGDSPSPLVTIDASWAGNRRSAPSGFSQSIPGNATMFVLLVALTYGAASITDERQRGLLRRLVTSPVSHQEIVLGKILGRFVISGLQISVLVAVAAIAGLFVELDLGGNLLSMWAVLLIYGACVAPFGVAMGAWFVDRDRAANIGVMATMAMAAFGGCWWPLEVVSRPLQTFAMVFPTTWVMRALHGLISFGHGWQAISPFIAVLVLFGIGFTALALRSLRVE